MDLWKGMMDARVLLGMLVVQVIAAGLQLLSRVILSEGTFIFALLTYRNILAALCVAPFALYFERYVRYESQQVSKTDQSFNLEF